MRMPLLALMLIVGCGDSDAAPDAQLEGGSGANPAQWIVVVQVRGGDEVTAAIPVEDIDRPEELDLGQGLSIPGRGTVVPSPFENDVLYAMSGEAPQLTRYRLLPDGSFVDEGTLVLEILTPFSRLFETSFLFASPEKAYVIDPFGAQLLVYDPTRMERIGSIEVPTDDVPAGFFPALSSQALRRGDRFYVSVGFIDTTREIIAPNSLILSFDSTTDEPATAISTDVCGYLRQAHLTAGGDVLFASDVFNASQEWATSGEANQPNCILRVVGEANVERVWPPDALPDGTIGGHFTFVSDTAALIRVIDPTLAPAPPTTFFEVNQGPFWRWALVEGLGAEPTFRILETEPGLAFTDALTFVEDGRYLIERPGDLSGSALVRVSSDGAFTAGLTSSQIITNAFPIGR